MNTTYSGWFIASVLVITGIFGMPAAADDDLTAKLQTLVRELDDDQQEALYTLLQGLLGEKAVAGGIPEEAVRAVAEKYKKVTEANDLEGQFALYSDDFESNWGDKAATKAFLDAAKAQGYMEGIQVDLSEIKIEVDGDKAKVTGIQSGSKAGAADMDLTLEKRGGNWIITELMTWY